MTMKYFLRPDSNIPPVYNYIEADSSDILWNPTICLEVEKRPTINHIYNWQTNTWELSETYYMADLRNKRNKELSRTDKFILEDFPILPDTRVIALQYRQALRNAPNQQAIEERVLPECPDVLKD